MKKYVTAFTLFSLASSQAPAFADAFKSGDRVEASAAFFMCGARDDLQTMQVLDRQGDRQTALKIGMERCEAGRPGHRYIVMQAEGDDICIRGESNPYCLWAWRASLHTTPSQ
jgi:hypothetical protein